MRALLATISLCVFCLSVSSPATAQEGWAQNQRSQSSQWYQRPLFTKHIALPQTHERVGRYIKEKVASLGGRPAGAPSRWCGFWLRHHLGIGDASLNLARNWARVGSPATPDTANVVVWGHHVGKLIKREGNQILVLSGNDGHAVRQRWRSASGVIAWRRV